MELLNKYYSPEIVDTLVNKKYLINKLGSVEVNTVRWNDMDKINSSEEILPTNGTTDKYCRENAGFYFSEPFEDKYKATTDRDTYNIFANLYIKSMKNSTYNMLYDFHMKDFKIGQDVDNGLNKNNIKVEQFHEDIGIYMELLQHYTSTLNKKVLIVSSMVDSIKSQLLKMKDIYPQYEIKTENIILYKSFNTILGNNAHSNWYETYTIMIKDIEKIDFDYCFMGCGAYGPPIAHHIFKTLNKSVFSIGASIQLMFGVIGLRWIGRKHIHPYFIRRYHNDHWIRPSEDEKPTNYENVESGCYW